MTTEQGMLFALISALFVFLIWGRYHYDLVAFGALLFVARCRAAGWHIEDQ